MVRQLLRIAYEGTQLAALGVGEHRPALGVVDDRGAERDEIGNIRHVHVEMDPILDRLRIRHRVDPYGVLVDPVDEPVIVAAVLDGQAKGLAPEVHRHRHVDGIQAQILVGDVIGH